MSWTIRHQGSPRSIENLTVPQVVEGLQEGLWETTDEVMGPNDDKWIALENHPQFAEVAEELEAPPPRVHDDETRLDMNPLIDVTLVLLIFFILTTTYAALEKVLDLGGMSSTKPEGVPVVRKDVAEKFMIKVDIRMDRGQPAFFVEDEEIDEEQLVPAIKRWVKAKQKTELYINAPKNVPWGAVVAVQDAAKGADVQKVHHVKQN
jgi:biopolymer transport protein ExbD